MKPGLPPRLTAAIDALLEGVSRKDLAVRSQAISARYRAGAGSAAAIAGAADVLAYAVSRLPATYAVARAVFDRLAEAAPDFAPASLLDAGAGPATASWAALDAWPAIARVTLTDSNPHFLELARHLSPRADAVLLPHDLAHGALPNADLVVASFVLAEIPSAGQGAVVETLYEAARDVLVLIEPGTPAGFARLRAARIQLIGQGAHILGPCTHANACPMIGPDWCHFSQRLPRSRDHLQAKNASVPFEDERYSWLAVSRARRSALEGRARVLAPPIESKPGIALKLCTARGLESRPIARRDRETYSALRRVAWGDVVVF